MSKTDEGLMTHQHGLGSLCYDCSSITPDFTIIEYYIIEFVNFTRLKGLGLGIETSSLKCQLLVDLLYR